MREKRREGVRRREIVQGKRMNMVKKKNIPRERKTRR
jgi:hypothetical protein